MHNEGGVFRIDRGGVHLDCATCLSNDQIALFSARTMHISVVLSIDS